MAKPEEPLNEVSLNTPARRLAQDPLSSNSGHLFAKCGSENLFQFESRRNNISSQYVSHHYEFIAQTLKVKKPIRSQIDLIHQSLAELYRIFIRLHSWDNLRLLTKRHLMIIVALLNEGDAKAAHKEILHLFNASNFQKVRDLDGILLADFAKSNEHYLSNLKLLALQTILKNNRSQHYQDSIMEFFALDHRFLLKAPNFKAHMTVQLLLNYFTVLPKFKVLLGLKFLQYLKQFNLRFETYIVNMDLQAFQKELKRRAYEMAPECGFYLRCFYDQYSMHDATLGKIMHSELFAGNAAESLAPMELFGANKPKPERTVLSKYNSHHVIFVVTECLKADSMPLEEHLLLLKCFWEAARYDGTQNGNRKKEVFDNTLTFLNDKMSSFEHDTSSLHDLLNLMGNYCIDSEQVKRLSNVINVLFNCFVISKKMTFLKLAAKFECDKYLKSDTKVPRLLIEKFEKFISRIKDPPGKTIIFGYLFNIQLICCEQLGAIQTFCQKVYIRCFLKLRLTKFVDFDFCSEVMMAFLYGNSSIRELPLDTWSPLTRMLHSCLSGTFHPGAIEVNPEPNKWHFLYKYEVLIKAAYCFNIEMSKHSTSNLASIVKSYMKKWIGCRSPIFEEKATVLEIDYLRMLLQYLEFNNFDKLSIELIECLRSNNAFYETILPESERFLLSAYINLQMVDDIKRFKIEFHSTSFEFKSAKLETLLHFLETELRIVTWERDYEGFSKLFVHELPKIGKEVLDIDNNFKKTSSQYIKVLLFNINLLISASTLQLSRNNILGAVTESKKALKLSVSLLKKSSLISEGSRLRVVHSLASSYVRLVSLFVHIGVSRDSDFYANELSGVICELNEPSVVYKCLQFLHDYYQLTGQTELASSAMKKSNSTFDYIDGESNILALTSFFFINGEYDKLFDALRLFFEENLKKTSLPHYWRLKMGYVVDESLTTSKDKSSNELNKMNEMYQKVMNQLENDPFFKTMFDSMVIIPSCHPPVDYHPPCGLHFSLQNPITSIPTASPRSSNMTPKDKSMKHKFYKAAAINNLKLLKSSAERLDLSSLKNHELSRVASFYSLALSLLSNLSIDESFAESLVDEFALSELSKCMPLYYDKIITTIGSQIYNSFRLLPINAFSNPVKLQRDRSLEAQRKLRKSSFPFSVVSIDFCPVTKSLLLSKVETSQERNVHIRMPLNRANTRDLDSITLTFEDARKELFDIIEESNASTSVEVTSSINTRNERKKWWQTRYELDRRLQELLNNIEVCWFNGIKGFFSPEIIDCDMLEEFKARINDILQQNLPSRRQSGNPDTFLQIEDWVMELILKLNAQDDDFVSMMEDLIYLILDVLLYHGEENAFDEIDVGVMHVQLEELVKQFRPRLLSSRRLSHTFLVISSDCHMFPWESLSFLKTISVTRVPSFSILNDLISKSNDEVSPEISLQQNIAMILNPHGDLSKTESRFSDLFKEIAKERPNSSLLINQKPDERTFLEMVSSSNLFIYLGHGGGEQYARIKEIKKFNHIAPSFLLGCSSASMGLFGKLEPTGTVYSYLLGGCSSVLGNLWDVTDKDIDKFSESVFEKIGLGYEPNKHPQEEHGISMAVSSSRDVCHLKYLNGAAPVVYGLPMRFK